MLIFIITHAHTHVQNARKGGGRVSSRCYCPSKINRGCPSCVTSQAAAAIVRAPIFINAHSSPPLSRFTRNFFELEIFSDNAARPKIKSHENLSNENFVNEKRANYGISIHSRFTNQILLSRTGKQLVHNFERARSTSGSTSVVL